MALELTTPDLFLSGPAAVAGAGWLIAGVALAVAPGVRRRGAALAAAATLLAGSALAMSGVDLPAWVLGPLGLDTFLQWLVAAGLVLSALPAKKEPRAASFLPMALLSLQGLGAVAVAICVVGTGALERGQRRRAALLAGLVLLSVAPLIDANSLWLWGQYGARLQLSFDQASWAVDLTEIAAQWAGFGALITWTIRPRR